MQQPAMTHFVGHQQAACLRAACRGSEGKWFRDKIREVQAVIDLMPTTGETDGLGNTALAQLHYFLGGADAWIIELDKGAPGDTPDQYQSQAFGVVDLGYGPERGYVSIPELLKAGMELDLYWKPISLAEVEARQ